MLLVNDLQNVHVGMRVDAGRLLSRVHFTDQRGHISESDH